MAAASPSPRWSAVLAQPAPWLVALAAFLLQAPLVLNPGYWSHDELQWAYHATHMGHGVDWFDVGTFQYRPLTFNLWMALSRALFDEPQAFHAVLVAWGAGNAALLHAIGRRAGVDARASAVAAVVFALSPYAVMAQGWVGTIADLAWLSCGLAIAWVGLRSRSLALAGVFAAVATLVGLLAKEAALSIPLVASVAWVFARDKRWAAVAAGAWAAAIAYLAVRLPVLLDAPGEPTLYAAKLSNVAVRWVEYQLFTPMVRVIETHSTLASSGPKFLLMSAILWCAWLAAMWRGSPRIATYTIIAGGAALGPVLLLGSAFNHYAYGFATVYAVCGAAAWARTARWGRIALGTMAVMTVLHGIVVMGVMFEVGRVQSVFSPALADVLRVRPLDAPPVRLRPDADAKEWMFVRLTHEIPAYREVPIGARVVLVSPSEPADFTIARDGTLAPVR
ncbi:hypothetical protein LF41_1429 [Lysobacter dokdonensis DS-58]|uniref:Glycosyltransferase RgtA/B/C/D-like domain-containing protein n=1 Tax=Lysobacter dokdonensis DS-58 TaxID=1300345 RepID=A0A0A2WIK0_9GAMM|nr:hypothetical protein [Lysobacter dokdonensis]KGQ18075.1 hypothetical protein LF41_1429 [Lysobacter dokdonensis DS-58]